MERCLIVKHGAITLTQARAEALKINSIVIQGGDPCEKLKKETTEDIFYKKFLEDFYIDWYRKNRKSTRSTINILQNTLLPFHKLKLNQITPSYVNSFAYKYQSENQCSNARVNRILTALKGSLSRAVEFNYIKVNPLTKFKMLKENSQKIRYLSNKETQRFFDVLENQNKLLRDIVMTAYYTGMRRGEIFSLKWCDIDYNTNQITLDGKNTKSNKSRSIPLHEEINKILKNRTKRKDNDYIFKSPVTGGKLIDIKTSWQTFIKEAKIENFRFHDLRHNFCSMLVMKGVPIYTVAQLAGHSDVKTTQIYAHLSPDVKKSAIDLL